LLRAPAPALAADLAAIRYASSMAVNLLYRSEDLPRPLEGFGFVVPAVEKRTALACTFSSRKYAGRAPEGHELLRCFAGGALFPEKLELSDERIVDEIRGDLRDLLGITSPPRDVIVSRWHRAMAQYDVGHTEVMRRVDAALAYLPGLELVGNGYRGIGIPDCVRQGRAAALRLRATLAR
jgi:oxygen-dependent protoporphyrinogen oxidase